MKTFLRNTLILILLVVADQILKYLFAVKKAYGNLGIVVLHFVTNTGASFGMLQGNNALLAWFSIIVLGIIMIISDKVKKEQVLPVLIIVSGIIGNLIDRVFRGFVVDFIDFKFWPVFNLADSCIVIGVIWLAIVIIANDFKEMKAGKNKKVTKKQQKGKTKG